MRQSPLEVSTAAELLAAGGVLLYPTEGVAGLGCDPGSAQALDRLLAIKGRAMDKGLILIAADVAMLDRFIDTSRLGGDGLQLMATVWPGPTTLILPARDGLDARLTGGRATIAARVSAHPVVRELSMAFGGALTSTSANAAGEPAPARMGDVDAAIEAAVAGVVAGECGGLGRPSRIIDAATGETLRA